MSKVIVKARDLRAATKYITIGGVRLRMLFNNYAYYLAEDIYDREFGRDIGFEAIIADASAGKIRALLALVYATVKAGGNEEKLGTFQYFMENFDLEDMKSISADVIEGISETLPDVEDEGKNA